jgi:hypothetical protein
MMDLDTMSEGSGWCLSNRIKARLTVLLGLLVVLGWRLVMQQAEAAARIPFPPLIAEQLVSLAEVQIDDCSVAAMTVHTQSLVTPSPDQQATAVLSEGRAALLVRSVATAYLQRDYQTPARVGQPSMVVGDFLGEDRLAWGQVWQPSGFDGTYAETDALLIYVDAVAAVPLMVYTDLQVAPDVRNCLLPPPPHTLADQLQRGLPVIVVMAAMLIAFGVLLQLRMRSVVAVSR